MTKEEAVVLLCEHFSEGLVRTIVNAIAKEERDACIALAEKFGGDWCVDAIRARGQE
jgi:hypothetical protein